MGLLQRRGYLAGTSEPGLSTTHPKCFGAPEECLFFLPVNSIEMISVKYTTSQRKHGPENKPFFFDKQAEGFWLATSPPHPFWVMGRLPHPLLAREREGCMRGGGEEGFSEVCPASCGEGGLALLGILEGVSAPFPPWH